jgi:hypothetical protein
MKVGIGIICIGDRYLKDFEVTFKPSIVSYAQRHGYDLKVFNHFLDSTYTHTDSISFQKCLVPENMLEYDRVLIMDADIWLSDSAPLIPDTGDLVGIVNEAAQVEPDLYNKIGFASQPVDYYKLSGFELDTDKILNTGFIVCNPKLHAKFMRDVYDKYIKSARGHHRGFHYEQSCIGYELQMHNLFTLLPNTWNTMYLFYSALQLPHPQVYGMHFAGLHSYAARESQLRRYLTVHIKQGVRRWGIRK